MNQDFYRKLVTIISEEKIKQNELLACHTTFRIGGPADYFVLPENPQEAAAVLKLCRKEQMPYSIIGYGSNLLVSDAGYRGLILKFPCQKALVQFWQENDRLCARAGAGVPLMVFARDAAKAGATGFEFAAGIPGSVGGAVYMNAGAYGGEIKDYLVAVSVLDEEGNCQRIAADELELGYRHSVLQQKPWYVYEAEFTFPMGETEAALQKIDELMRMRREKQPLEYPSAGSTFKRPEGYFAGKLIMDAGLAGFRIGGAAVSAKHCGFVINEENASADDIMAVVKHVQKTVKERYSVDLELEVRLLGDFS
ncbi:MAG: UDP-N-acetylmuramate dehydrogenase [Lachnospiraceae bacterium]|nr:UDP-N-acetylmuramate dehydrogenase [Lachnospiraceae bacterium]